MKPPTSNDRICEEVALNGVDNKNDNIHIKTEELDVKIEDSGFMAIHLAEENTGHSNDIDEIHYKYTSVLNQNSEQGEEWNKEFTYSGFIKHEETDPLELPWDKQASSNVVSNKSNSTNITTEKIYIKTEENGESLGHIENSHVVKQMIEDVTDKNINISEYQTIIKTENNKSGWSLMDEACTNKHSGTYKEPQIHKHTVTNVMDYTCDECNKVFKNSDNLVQHKLTHIEHRPYKCDVCSKRFTKANDLTKHKRTHTGEKPYKCDVCNKAFTQSTTLKMHKFTHTGERPYKCDVCNKNFIQANSLKIHKFTHTGEKPYECDVCTKRFTRLNKLVKHKLIHNDERPYQCDLCNKAFTQLRYLTLHKFIHTGEKPYECDVCSRRFTRSDQLGRHKLTHTSERPYT